jgi:NADPH2:quinone reductase
VLELTGPAGVSVAEVPDPEAGGEALVEVHAAGISFPDLLRSQGLYQDKTDPPFTLGSEFAGVLREAPAGSVLQRGARVAGIAAGAAAELVVAPAEALLPLPDSTSYEQGAALILNYETAITSLEVRGRMKAGETVLVHGAAGGTGTAAIQVAQALGGRAFAVVSSDAKEKIAREAGADEVLRVDGPWKDEALRLTGGRGVDLVFDPVGGDLVLDTMRSLGIGGRWLIVGFVGGPIPQIPANRILLRNIDVVGSYYGGLVGADPEARRRIRSRLRELLETGRLRPVVGSRHDLDHGADALRDLAERRALGKVVVTVR